MIWSDGRQLQLGSCRSPAVVDRLVIAFLAVLHRRGVTGK